MNSIEGTGSAYQMIVSRLSGTTGAPPSATPAQDGSSADPFGPAATLKLSDEAKARMAGGPPPADGPPPLNLSGLSDEQRETVESIFAEYEDAEPTEETRAAIDAALEEAGIDPDELRPERPKGPPPAAIDFPAFDELTGDQQEGLQALLAGYDGEDMTASTLRNLAQDLRELGIGPEPFGSTSE